MNVREQLILEVLKNETMKISELIKKTRQITGESQAIFGQRFGNTGGAVSLRESDHREAPYKVIELCLDVTDFTKTIKNKIDQTVADLQKLKKLL